MPNVGDIIRAADFSGAGIEAGAVVPFYNVTLSGRYPIFWGKTEANTGWLVCDGGSDLHGGNVPNLSNRFIMGVTSVSEAKKTGGSSDITLDSTTLTVNQMPSHNHSVQYTSGTINNPHGGMSGGDVHSRYFNTTNTGSSQSHTHSFSGTFTPPYYSLIYLVKLP